MVLSRINDNIDYSEKKYADPEDTNFEASLYQIIVKDTEIIIALGDIKYKYRDLEYIKSNYFLYEVPLGNNNIKSHHH